MRDLGTCTGKARLGPSRARLLALLALSLLTAALLASAMIADRAEASAIVDNGTIQLGVGDRGHLVVAGGPAAADGFNTNVGLRYLPTNAEGVSVAFSNSYEGWGAADATSRVTGYVSPDHPGYSAGTHLVSFTSTATTAVSVVDVVGSGNGPNAPATLRVTHDYHPSALTPNLYEATVTIKNLSAAAVDPRYRRTINWTVSPTNHDEFVTIGGTLFPGLRFTSNSGYWPPDPLLAITHSGGVPFMTGFFTDAGPQDEGATFDFGFDTLLPDESVTFQLYFGAASSEDDAEAAIAVVGAETWSLGEPNTLGGPTLGTPNTFVFAYSSASGPQQANDLRLRQIAPAAINGPDQLDVRAELKNIGAQDATNVATDIVLPSGLTLVSGSAHHAFAGTLMPAAEVNHTWRVSAPGACADVTYRIKITATFDGPGGAGPFTRMRERDLLVRGTCSQISGRVVDAHTGSPLQGAYVFACPAAGGGCPAITTTDSAGHYALTSLGAGSHNLSVSAAGAYITQSRTVALTAGQRATEDFQLSNLHGPPPGTAVAPTIGTNPDGVPLLPRVPTTVTGNGCTGANATFTVKRGSTLLASGAMPEGPAGTYTSAPFGPFTGILTIETVIACQNGSVETTVFNCIYIDPSGTVRTTAGDPIAGATVILLRSDVAAGPFTRVPDGDAIMSPANRRNPDVTDATGHFGWDVIPGYYIVRASKAGCTGPDGADAVQSAALQIPPPVTDLDLRLSCPRPPVTDNDPPQTTIASGPADGSTTGDVTPTFGLSSSEVGSSFECRVDTGTFAPCSSPHTTAVLANGRHAFEARAVDAAGNRDQTPARRGFTVNASRPVAAGVRISRRAAAIVARLTCPREASSSCRITLTLKLTRRAAPHRARVVTLLTRRVVVTAGKSAKLTLRRPEITARHRGLRLHVRTATSAGTTSSSYAIGR